ncbi:MAG: type III-B CRISPR module RAMP protein Cmr4 [Elusimicrobiota bacterium]
MNQANALLGLITETSLHAGAGSSVGAIDLPIQREGHNGWPCVFGSAVKGSLRDRAEAVFGLDSEDVFTVFGPNTMNASDNAGAIAVGDARLLLLPVRSLTSSFKWVTCAEALNRFKRLAGMLGVGGFIFDVPTAAGTEALTAQDTGDLFLEEYRFTQRADTDKLPKVIEVLARLVQRIDAQAELTRRLVVVSDDMFSHLVQAAVPVNAHIALDSKSKTVAGGALWYEETLPPETLLYVPLMAANSRREKKAMSATDVLGKVTGLFIDKDKPKPWLQLGGNETVGMGWCAITVLKNGG